MTRVSTSASADAELRFTGNTLARFFYRCAVACGGAVDIKSITFTEPVQAVADRIAVEEIVERSRVP